MFLLNRFGEVIIIPASAVIVEMFIKLIVRRPRPGGRRPIIIGAAAAIAATILALDIAIHTSRSDTSGSRPIESCQQRTATKSGRLNSTFH